MTLRDFLEDSTRGFSIPDVFYMGLKIGLERPFGYKTVREMDAAFKQFDDFVAKYEEQNRELKAFIIIRKYVKQFGLDDEF